MGLLIDRDGLKMWIDDFSPIIFLKFTAMPAPKMDTRKEHKEFRSLLPTVKAKFENLYSVIDITDCKGKCSVTLAEFCYEHFPELFKSHIKYLAFVKAPSADLVLESHLQNVLPNGETRSGCFQDFYLALGKINSLREKQLSLN